MESPRETRRVAHAHARAHMDRLRRARVELARHQEVGHRNRQAVAARKRSARRGSLSWRDEARGSLSGSAGTIASQLRREVASGAKLTQARFSESLNG